MKESISYTFLLNIIITFIFICFAVVMGIFSYYRAFRANTAILNSIEKYEGFNCLSKEEANKSLANIGYKTPFRANRKTDGRGTLLTSDNSLYGNLGYSVVYSDLGNREYQYGVYTYMYMDLPVVNSLIKLSVFGKTNKMYEFRDLLVDFDIRLLVDSNDFTGGFDSTVGRQSSSIEDIIADYGANYDSTKAGSYITRINPRAKYKMDFDRNGVINISDVTGYRQYESRKCGTFIDYSIYN